MQRLIGITGRAGAGKGSVASILAQYGFHELSFASPLYAAVSCITGLSEGDLKDRRLKERELPGLGVSPRRLLQTLGTEWGRQMIADDIWIRIAERAAYSCPSEQVAFSDLRFANEAEWILSQGGEVWEVTRQGPVVCDEMESKHASESGLTPRLVTRRIENNGSLEHLHSKVVDLLK